MSAEPPEGRWQPSIDALFYELAQLVTDRRTAVLENRSLKGPTDATGAVYFDDSQLQAVAEALAKVCSASRTGKR